jgi:hypothetical protein
MAEARGQARALHRLGPLRRPRHREHGPRVVASTRRQERRCYITGKVYGVDQVREVTRGFEANASLVTGGVRILDSSGIVYLDLHPGS